jgi:hypothetical protein
VRLCVLTAVTKNITFLQDVALCSPVHIYQCLGLPWRWRQYVVSNLHEACHHWCYLHVTELEPSQRIPSVAVEVICTPLQSAICHLAERPIFLHVGTPLGWFHHLAHLR